ncbi:ATP-binding protein [Streptomyces sp. NBC_00091]|uniref:ATP-binding protein n=1 Tax=Streptomyces sp. NBC_00091 TaxID=2975648 RepID=UPI00225A6C02|nr:ATP-binding protein [Streptomyces sp. NBC_00091]MCX5377122.1 ATP-binding protein [Streptomyces sp. NBC_00091]
MSIWWSLHLRREAASVPLARRLLLGTMETAGVEPDICYDLSVALSEACANAVEHGGLGGGPGEGPGGAPAGGVPDGTEAYHVTAYLDGDRCRIEVTDSGPGFPPSTVARRRSTGSCLAEDGRGLHLIAELADHVRFRNRPGRGAVVSFDKMLKWRDDALLRVS